MDLFHKQAIEVSFEILLLDKYPIEMINVVLHIFKATIWVSN
jgi:hypothetical protein